MAIIVVCEILIKASCGFVNEGKLKNKNTYFHVLGLLDKKFKII